MSVSDDERIKISANALNTMSTSMITIGVVAPFAGIIYGVSAAHREPWLLFTSAMLWVLIGGALHYAARELLRRIEA